MNNVQKTLKIYIFINEALSTAYILMIFLFKEPSFNSETGDSSSATLNLILIIVSKINYNFFIQILYSCLKEIFAL